LTDRALYRPRWREILLSGFAVVSIYEAYQGTLDPWRPAFPELRLLSAMGTRPPAVALSGYASLYQVPDDVRESLGANDIVPRKFDAARSLVIPQGLTWWFIDGQTPLAPEIAQPLGLNVPATATLKADLYLSVQNWLNTFKQTAVLDGGASISLPLTFNGELDLLGYHIEHRSGGFSVLTVWRIRAQPAYREQRKISFDLASTDGVGLQHLESFGVQYDSLQSGDIVIHSRWIPEPAAPLAQYVLKIGVVDPATGARLATGFQTDAIIVKLDGVVR
jgi:hypothetical protein